MERPEQSRETPEAPPQARDRLATQRNRLERLSQRVTELERANAELETSVAVAAHELLTTLVMAQAHASVVTARLEGDHHARSRRDLQALMRGVVRTRALVEALLSDALSTGAKLDVGPVDTSALVADCLAMLAPEVEARGARVELGHLPEVSAHEGLLTGVFANLIVNALKYGPRRDAVIRISAGKDAGGWKFNIDSRGPTVAPQERDRLFGPFNRAPGERRERGLGLGLAICRRIVERHGGTLGVTDAEGSGNRFYFTLPPAER
jgi:signal transduction histidine kinase